MERILSFLIDLKANTLDEGNHREQYAKLQN
jgi:hypothetical protein